VAFAILAIMLAATLAGCHPRQVTPDPPVQDTPASGHSPEKAPRLTITLKIDGGFAYVPGLRRPTTLDTAHLADAQARMLEDLVRRADFFALPPMVGRPRPGSGDVRTFELTVSSGGRTHTVRAVEPVQNPDLDALIQGVQALSREPGPPASGDAL
jgi:hypothetical protein